MVRPSKPGPGTDVERTRFPVFGLCWSTSLLVHCGGGGSSKTGVGNCIVCSNGTTIDTGDQICVSCDVYPRVGQEPVFVAAAIGDGGPVCIYHSSTGHCMGQYFPESKDWAGFNYVKFSPNGHGLLAGCENGTVVSFGLHWENVVNSRDHNNMPKVHFTKLAIFKALVEDEQPSTAAPSRQPPPILIDHMAGHSKAICGVAYHPLLQANQCLTCAKDGCIKVWDFETGELKASVACPIWDMSAPAPKRPPQVLVRGCCYGINNFIYTVQSGRRGKAFVSQWRLALRQPLNQHSQQPKQETVLVENNRICIAEDPISAMCMSADMSKLFCGSVEGSVIVLDAESLRVIQVFDNIHDLPITCISPRPSKRHVSPEMGIHSDVEIITGSADSKLVRLSTRRQPMSWIAFYVNSTFFLVIFVIIWYSTFEKECYVELLEMQFRNYQTCIHYSLVASNDMPGVHSIPM